MIFRHKLHVTRVFNQLLNLIKLSFPSNVIKNHQMFQKKRGNRIRIIFARMVRGNAHAQSPLQQIQMNTDLTCTRQNPPGVQEVEIIVCRVEVLVGSVTGI